MGYRTVIITLAGGTLIGVGAAILLRRINRNLAAEVARLAAKVDRLNREVEELRRGQAVDDVEEDVVDAQDTLQLTAERRLKNLSYSASSVLSSGEEDDEDFEDTVEGTEEFSAHSSEGSPPSLTGDGYASADENFTDFKSEISSSSLLQKADKLLEGTDGRKEEAYNLLNRSQSEFKNNPEYLWRLAKATFLQSQNVGALGENEKKKSLVYAASQIAAEALELCPDSSNIQKWYAITLGSIGDYESIQVKITNGYKFKEHIEKSIKLNPNDASTHHLLGRWCYRVYMLSWMERKLAATLFATPPTATIDEALAHFLKANELGAWKENLLYTAKCYIEKKEYNTALSWLEKAKKLPTVDTNDKEAEVEIVSLLSKYSYYRT